MNTPDIREATRSIHIKNEDFCRDKYPEFTECIIQTYPNTPHMERLYRYFHPDVTNICPVCGKPTKFVNFNKGYNKYCCGACASRDPEVKKKKIDTCIQNYGVSNPSQCSDIVDKKRNTMLNRYGVTNTSKLSSNRKQAKQTCLDRYGNENVMLVEDIRNKIIQHNRNKYGVDWPLSLKSVKEKADKTYIELYGGRGSASQIIKDRVRATCLERYGDPTYSNRPKAKETMLKLYGEGAYHHSCIHKDTNEELFVQNILDEHNIDYYCSNRSILDGKELDIYIPSEQIAIEVNGCHWHSIWSKDKKYHFNKYNECFQKGIQLITIWDDQIKRMPELIKSMILSKLGIYQSRIYARKCQVREVCSKDSISFLSHNHIQGAISSSVRLGLYYNDELVSIMTFGKRRKALGQSNADGIWELYRYCNKQNTQVIGGASKLLHYFTNTFHPDSIESFSSNDISNGNLYRMLNFKEVGNSISYWYVKDYKRYHRFTFTKKRLIDMGCDPNKTEKQIMSENRYECIYDSGQTKWILDFNSQIEPCHTGRMD